MYTDKKPKLRFSFNSPALLGFVIICVAAQVLNVLTAGLSNELFFSVYRSSLLSPLTYLRLIGHVFGHADWSHLFNNMMYILILGPILEEKYGTSNLIFVIIATAVVTGLINIVFFPDVILLGASGIVFAMILLASITSTKERAIPITFVLVAIMYIGEQIYTGIVMHDNVSQLTHIAGGIVGSILGFAMNRNKMSRFGR